MPRYCIACSKSNVTLSLRLTRAVRNSLLARVWAAPLPPRGDESLSGKGGERPLLFSPPVTVPWPLPACCPSRGVLSGAAASFLTRAARRGLQPDGQAFCPIGTSAWVPRGEGLGEECTPLGSGNLTLGVTATPPFLSALSLWAEE